MSEDQKPLPIRVILRVNSDGVITIDSCPTLYGRDDSRVVAYTGQFFNHTGKLAADIPKGNTPGCGYSHFPMPVLAQCTEPLPEGADDIRGLWVGVKGGHVGHLERVEQCGSRVVVTTSGVIHDYGPNSTAGLNTDDTEGSVLFTIGSNEYCMRSSASMIWNNGMLDFHAFGWGPVVVKRYLEGEQLVWEYADGSTTHMGRLCSLPEEHKVPRPRGKRMAFFSSEDP